MAACMRIKKDCLKKGRIIRRDFDPDAAALQKMAQRNKFR